MPREEKRRASPAGKRPASRPVREDARRFKNPNELSLLEAPYCNGGYDDTDWEEEFEEKELFAVSRSKMKVKGGGKPVVRDAVEAAAKPITKRQIKKSPSLNAAAVEKGISTAVAEPTSSVGLDLPADVLSKEPLISLRKQSYFWAKTSVGTDWFALYF